MCGIVGFISPNSAFSEQALHWVARMADQIRHRGPDGYGEWSDTATGIALGHRRLAILDLSSAGHQPMHSSSGRYVISFNGEIYNHKALRKDLDASLSTPLWRGHSDTETLLAGFDAWGILATLKRAIGMFACAVWDRHTHTLTLARDRIGEKPLYFGWQDGVFLFASELKALRVHPAFKHEIDRRALSLLLQFNCIPAPHSIYRGISKLLPGTLLTLSLPDLDTKLVPFWSATEVVTARSSSPFVGSPLQAVDALETLLKDSIAKQMVADVPLGAFLSGGVDSSTVVALMQIQSTRPIRTFSIGFNETEYNEAKNAKAVADYLRTDHTEMYVTPQQALEVIPKLPSLYCEPFSDSSQVPTFLVAALARQHVTVSLSGDAGDELFCGYNRYTLASRAWKLMSLLPISFRRAMAAALTTLSPETWTSLLKPAMAMLSAKHQYTNAGDMLHKSAGAIVSASAEDLYRYLTSHWDDAAAVVIGAEHPDTVLNDQSEQPLALTLTEQMMARDLRSYLPDDILVKVDRAAMGVSLETRVPFLDHRVVEFAWSLPLSYKLRNGENKWILRQVLYEHVPKHLVERPKTGFGMPIGHWLRGPLRDWAESLLAKDRLDREGFFRSEPIRRKWTEHLSGKRNWQFHLWDVLMFQAWLENQLGASQSASALDLPKGASSPPSLGAQAR